MRCPHDQQQCEWPRCCNPAIEHLYDSRCVALNPPLPSAIPEAGAQRIAEIRKNIERDKRLFGPSVWTADAEWLLSQLAQREAVIAQGQQGLATCAWCDWRQTYRVGSAEQEQAVQAMREHARSCEHAPNRADPASPFMRAVERAERAEALLTQRTQERDEALAESLRAHERLAELLEAHAGLQVRVEAAEGERNRLQAAVQEAVKALQSRALNHCCPSCDLTDDEREWKERLGDEIRAVRDRLEAILRAPAAPPGHEQP